jgi:cyclopropane-fatty-acyl-phospholipid synthase
MAPLLERLFGGDISVRFVFWDGSALGPEDGPGTVVLRSACVLTRLIWSPDELGITRSFIAGDLDLDGRLFDLLETLHGAMSGARQLGSRTLASALWAAVRLSAIRRPPPRPAERFVLPDGVIRGIEMSPRSRTTTTSAMTSIASYSDRR